ncbi:uncharacterized protein LOC110031624 [Phalaenopsis equestris]|uniref:uncharacterized protein LOC110031624 n=1 Tax=Phalaenopsis equestris TaxID=78828 RepID=UPI0009E38E9E|nr:uncharacterized protein LOC110031624 [Phalaenopsis equestris]
MCFTFVVPGWEGTTKDATILTHVIGDPSYNFPAAFKGKYYLVNSQYPMRRGFLKPYMEYSHEYQKIFNERHSALHNVVKRAFRIWKEKWTVLQDMPFFSNEKQKLIIAATMALHNYIRRHHSQSNSNSGEFDENVEFLTLETQGYHVGDESLSQPGRDDDENNDTSMALRDRIAHELATCAVSI